jgi:hypothetical protein
MQNGLVMAGTPDIPQTWETLFSQALKVIGEIARHGRDDPFWTFGGAPFSCCATATASART